MKKEQNNTDPAKEQEKAKQIQQLKKYGFFALVGIIFLGALYLIFAPSSSEKEKEEQGKGFNTEIPDPNNRLGIIGDKQKAYEQEALMRNKRDKRKSLEDFTSLIEDDKSEEVESVDITRQSDENETNDTPSDDAIKKSTSSYKNINQTLSGFYEKRPETEVDEKVLSELEERLQNLESKSGAEDKRKSTIDEQFAIVEKSYQMAAKYMPNSGQQTPQTDLEAGTSQGNSSNNGKNNKTQISVIKQVHEQTVSALAQNVSNQEFIESFYQPRNIGFNTMDANIGVSEKNTISAVIHDDHTLISGQSVRLRTTEAMIAGTTIIPANSILTGTAALQGERLGISINSIEIGGAIIPVEMNVYDSDGQYGIFIPNSLELEAIKEIAANMGNSVGTSVSITSDAGEQIAADLSKGAIQGMSQYMQKKIRQVKVHLKSGYRVFLLPKQS